MKKTILMSAAKKARIALAVMAVCGFTFAGAQSAFAENVTIDAKKNIICGDGAKVEKHPESAVDAFNAIVIGNSAEVGAKMSIAIGCGAKTGKMATVGNGDGNIAIGPNAQALDDATIAIGGAARATAFFTTAIGNMSRAEGSESIAIGRGWAEKERSMAIGNYSEAKYKNSIAIGYHSVASAENTVSVGSVYEEWVGFDSATGEMVYKKIDNRRRITYMADGVDDHDAATVGQVITNIQKNGNTLEFYTGKGTDGSGTKKWEFDLAAGGGSTLTQDDFNNMLNASTKFNDLQTAVGNKANANGDNITTGAGSKWAETLGTGAIVDGDKNLVNGETVYNKIGDLNSLNTTEKGNLVGAVNEVNNKANANEKNIGDLTKLTTTEKGNLVGAVNEVNNKANANEKNIGDLTKLNTTEKGNLVGAVNEVNKKAYKNAEDIKTVNGRVDELGGRVDTLGGAVSKLDTKVNKVGAGAAALAALHPMEFDSDNKLSFAAGVGNYRGTNAAAIGAFYRPSEQVMFSISGNMGNGENMVNAGVSFALDRPSKTPTTKAALVKTVVAQNEQIAALNETVAEQNEKIARLEAMVEKLAAQGK